MGVITDLLSSFTLVHDVLVVPTTRRREDDRVHLVSQRYTGPVNEETCEDGYMYVTKRYDGGQSPFVGIGQSQDVRGLKYVLGSSFMANERVVVVG